jgi:hypothetical protein
MIVAIVTFHLREPTSLDETAATFRATAQKYRASPVSSGKTIG